MALSVVVEEGEEICNGKDLCKQTQSKGERREKGRKYILEGPAIPSGRLSTSITSFECERGSSVDADTNWISSSSRRSTSITSGR